MKTTLNLPKEEKDEGTYPRFMMANNCIVVYFIKENEGYLIIDSESRFGHTNYDCSLYLTIWDMEHFKPMPKGSSITIEF